MNAAIATETVYADFKTILDGAGLKNGLGADKKGICYYPYNRLTIAPTDCQTFVTYELLSLDNRGKADRLVYAIYAILAIDIWTVKDPTSSDVLELFKTITAQAEKLGYSVETDTASTYNYGTTNYCIAMTLSRLIR